MDQDGNSREVNEQLVTFCALRRASQEADDALYSAQLSQREALQCFEKAKSGLATLLPADEHERIFSLPDGTQLYIKVNGSHVDFLRFCRDGKTLSAKEEFNC